MRHTDQVTIKLDQQVDDADLHFRELLDHIAVELADEYVRLMEAAAKATTDDQQVEEEEI